MWPRALTPLLLIAAAPAPSQPWNLTPDGLGPVRIGMSRAQVEKALHVKLEGEPLDDEQSCIEMVPAGADQVHHAYRHGLKAEDHYYEGRPAEYLTFWTAPGRRGVRFETDSKRRVQTIHAGTESIQLVEGCA